MKIQKVEYKQPASYAIADLTPLSLPNAVRKNSCEAQIAVLEKAENTKCYKFRAKHSYQKVSHVKLSAFSFDLFFHTSRKGGENKNAVYLIVGDYGLGSG